MTRRYPAYRDSGVVWLGEVPAGWEVKRLRRFARLKTDKAITALNPIALENIESWSGRIIPTETEFQGEGVAFDRGDILFGKLRPYLAKVAVAEAQGEAVGDFHVISPTAEIDSYFLQRHLLAPAVISVIDGSTYGSKMPRASWDFMADLQLAVPPLPEQTAIAAFLDRETAKIDALVAEQRRLIDLLKEKRQAVISHAVTRGLNTAAKLKPSGVDWLGDVPEGWELMPLRYLIDFIESGTSVNATDTPASGDELGVLKTSCVYTGGFDPKENKAVVPEEYDRTSCPLRSGSLIISRMNTPDLVGAAGYVAEAYANIFLPDRLWQVVMTRADAEFVHYWTMTDFYRGQVRAVCAGTSSSMQNLSQDAFKAFLIAVPPVEEQTSIVQSLKRQTVQLDALSEIARSAITLLQERRAALISAAVTGKIDVRDLVPQETEAA